MAFATARTGAPTLTNIDGLAPYVRETNVVAVGIRPEDRYAEEARHAGIAILDTAAVQRLGAAATGSAVLAALDQPELSGYWIHLDADVLDPR